MCDGGHVWQGGHVWHGGHVWQGACVAGGHAWQGGMHGRGHVWQKRQPLQRMVHILQECILVNVSVSALAIQKQHP